MRTLQEVPEAPRTGPSVNWPGRSDCRRPRSTGSGAPSAQTWLVEEFKLSTDPFLIDKVADVVGLYLAPPANAAGSR